MEIEVLPYQNAAELARHYEGLPNRLMNKAMRQALRRAARPVLQQAKINLRNIRKGVRESFRAKIAQAKQDVDGAVIASRVAREAYRTERKFKKYRKTYERVQKRKGFPAVIRADKAKVKQLGARLAREQVAAARGHVKSLRHAARRSRIARTRQWTGRLLRSGHITRATPRNRKMFGYVVSFNARSLRGKYKAPYAYFLEKGHGIGKRGRAVKNLANKESRLRRKGHTAFADELRRQRESTDSRDRTPPYPFLGPAFESRLSEVRRIIHDEWRANLAREAANRRATA